MTNDHPIAARHGIADETRRKNYSSTTHAAVLMIVVRGRHLAGISRCRWKTRLGRHATFGHSRAAIWIVAAGAATQGDADGEAALLLDAALGARSFIIAVGNSPA